MLGHMHHMRGISGNEGNFDGLAENVRTCSVGFVAQGEQEKSNFRPPPAPCLQSLGPIPSSRTYAGRKSMQPPRFGQNSLIWFRMPCSSWVPWCPSLPETNNICRNFCENRKRTDWSQLHPVHWTVFSTFRLAGSAWKIFAALSSVLLNVLHRVADEEFFEATLYNHVLKQTGLILMHAEPRQHGQVGMDSPLAARLPARSAYLFRKWQHVTPAHCHRLVHNNLALIRLS